MFPCLSRSPTTALIIALSRLDERYLRLGWLHRQQARSIFPLLDSHIFACRGRAHHASWRHRLRNQRGTDSVLMKASTSSLKSSRRPKSVFLACITVHWTLTRWGRSNARWAHPSSCCCTSQVSHSRKAKGSSDSNLVVPSGHLWLCPWRQLCARGPAVRRRQRSCALLLPSLF